MVRCCIDLHLYIYSRSFVIAIACLHNSYRPIHNTYIYNKDFGLVMQQGHIAPRLS